MSLLFEKCMAFVLKQLVLSIRMPAFFVSCQVCYKGCVMSFMYFFWHFEVKKSQLIFAEIPL